ncbi:hypothetical protein [Streptomyces sp. NPDC055287]
MSAVAGVRAGGLTQHADRLETAGLIRRSATTATAGLHLSLTRDGLEPARRVRGARDAQEEQLLAALGAADRRRLAALVGALDSTLGAGGPEQ